MRLIDADKLALHLKEKLCMTSWRMESQRENSR